MTADLRAKTERSLSLQGQLASFTVRKEQMINSLHDVEFTVTSQWGEDGIIDWLVERAGIPPHLRTFVEFGVERYDEANTRFLLERRNWRGLIIDSDPGLVLKLEKENIFWKHDLTAKIAFITRENINSIISEAGFRGELGLLSIDIDGMDYWVWEAITAIHPVFLVCEYNALLGDIWPVSVPYDPGFDRSKRHASYLYYGASIEAFRSLAAKKGYTFLGTNSAGSNAFFVRSDFESRFDKCIAIRTAIPSKFKESRGDSGELTFVRGPERSDLISHLPVVNVETSQTSTLDALMPIFSEAWQEQIGSR